MKNIKEYSFHEDYQTYALKFTISLAEEAIKTGFITFQFYNTMYLLLLEYLTDGYFEGSQLKNYKQDTLTIVNVIQLNHNFNEAVCYNTCHH